MKMRKKKKKKKKSQTFQVPESLPLIWTVSLVSACQCSVNPLSCDQDFASLHPHASVSQLPPIIVENSWFHKHILGNIVIIGVAPITQLCICVTSSPMGNDPSNPSKLLLLSFFTCKNEEDPMKNGRVRVLTRFSPL